MMSSIPLPDGTKFVVEQRRGVASQAGPITCISPEAARLAALRPLATGEVRFKVHPRSHGVRLSDPNLTDRECQKALAGLKKH